MEGRVLEKATIGDILKKRISELGHTQKWFWEEAGISRAAFRKYIDGKVAYDYELLDKFCKILDCSPEYLLGWSKSPKTEYKELADLRLSDDALDMLLQYAKDYDTNVDCKMYVRTLDAMIKVGELIPCMADYMIYGKQINQMYKEIGGTLSNLLEFAGKSPEIVRDNVYALDGESMQLIMLVSKLKDAQTIVGVDFAEELKEVKEKQKAMNQLETLSAAIREVTKRNG